MAGKLGKNRVHIAMVGETVENVIAGIMRTGASELYPIISENFEDTSYKALVDRLPGIKVHKDVKGRELTIDPFTEDSFEQMVEMIIDIVQYHPKKDDEFWINITGGTNLMSAAAEAGAVLTKSKAYYVVQGLGDEGGNIIVLPWHSMNPHILDERRIRILKTLEKGPISGKAICEKLGGKLSTRALVRYLKELESAGYIVRKPHRKEKLNELTSWGKIAIKLQD